MSSSPVSRFFRPPVALSLAFLYLQIQSPFFLKYLFTHPGSLTGAAVLEPMRFAAEGLLVFAFLLGAAALGEGVLPRRWRPEPFLERAAFALVIGQAVVSFGLMVLGLLGGFYRPLLAAVYLTLAAGGVWRFHGKARTAFARATAAATRPVGPVGFFLLFVLFAGLGRALIATAAPATDWDSLAYHLAFPRIFLTEGRLLSLPWSINAHYPLNAEMLYTLGLAVRGDVFCHWLNFAHGVALAAVVFSLGARFFSRGAGALGAALLVVQPVFQRVIGNASTDLAVALPLVLAVSCAAKAASAPEEGARSWGLAGLLTGLAASTKLTGLWMGAALMGVLLIRAFLGGPHRPGALRRFGGEALAFLFGMAAAGFPWYLRNYWTTGNPVWPYAAAWLGGGPGAEAAWARISASVTERVPFTPGTLLSLPWKLWSLADLFKYRPYFLTTPFFVLLFLRPFRRPAPSPGQKTVLGALGFFALLWLAVYPAWRYALPAAAWMAVFVGGFWAEIFQRPRARWVGAPLLALALIPLGDLSVNAESFPFWGVRSQAAPTLTSRERYCQLTLGDPYTLAREANALLPADARVLLYKDVRGFYLDRPYAWGDPLNPGVLDFNALKTPTELWHALRRMGFTHIVYNPFIEPTRGDRAYYDRADRLMADFLSRYGRALSIRGGGGLFAISAASADGEETAAGRSPPPSKI